MFRIMFTGWEAKDKIVRPILVNLLTAVILFLTAALLKDRIYDYFSPRRNTIEWPLFCVFESEVNQSPQAQLKADLFVINTGGRKYNREDLTAIANANNNEHQVNSFITLTLHPYSPESIINDVSPDKEYNKEKGDADTVKIDPVTWRIQIREIKESAILKFVVSTTVEKATTARADPVPITISYARSR